MSCMHSGSLVIQTPLFLELGKSVQISEFVIELYTDLCSITLIECTLMTKYSNQTVSLSVRIIEDPLYVCVVHESNCYAEYRSLKST